MPCMFFAAKHGFFFSSYKNVMKYSKRISKVKNLQGNDGHDPSHVHTGELKRWLLLIKSFKKIASYHLVHKLTNIQTCYIKK